ncbi:MAG: hypothetical protein R6U27_14205 [Desulfobacterales bacterium]
MKNLYSFSPVFLIFCIIFCFGSGNAAAHGTGHRFLTGADSVTVEFFYSDNEPMSYAEIYVFSPQDPKLEYQNGRTDQKGRFSFYPHVSGIWQIEAGDGMGHKETVAIEVPENSSEMPAGIKGETSQTTDNSRYSGVSRVVSVVAGLSLILNFFLLLYMYKQGFFPKK